MIGGRGMVYKDRRQASMNKNNSNKNTKLITRQRLMRGSMMARLHVNDDA